MQFARAKQLYFLLRKNQRLSVRRHPLFEQNKVMKWISYLIVAFWGAYFILAGVMFGQIDDLNYEIFDIIDGGMLLFLAVDFLIRFSMQETPAQQIKPYKLLPIPQKFLLNAFLVRIGLNSYNLFWFCFFVPFATFAVVKFYGLTGMLGYLLGWWLMFVLNSYWYLLWRTWMQRHWYTVLIPIVLYAALAAAGIFTGKWMFLATLHLGRGFCLWQWWALLLPIVLSVVLFFVNRRQQYRMIYSEIAQEEHVQQVRSREFSLLNRFGIIGEYLKLDIKSTMRNKMVRKQLLGAFALQLIFCALFAFTDVYDNQPFMRTFICMYCFSALGTTYLTGLLGQEGNYMDLLMSRKESVLALLKAKYIFISVLLILPLLFSIMPIAQSKITVMEAVASLLFTMGGIFPFLFQMAVYNNQTLRLNEQLTRANRSSRTQIIISFAALLLPIFIMRALVALLGTQTGCIILSVLGVIGILTAPLWLRNIYRRFMIRRYKNMEAFRDSRDSA